MVSIVVAYAENRGIGYEGRLPWRLPGDLRRFRELTIGGTVLMGRKTFQSLPDAYRPLPGRRNIVLSADPDFDAVAEIATQRVEAAAARAGPAQTSTSVEKHACLEDALRACGADCFVIGGGSVYEQALPSAQRVYATEVAATPLSDTWFPELPGEQWQRVEQGEAMRENGTSYRFATYDRIP